jgi:hypothetical protein
MAQGFSISDLVGWRLEVSRQSRKCVIVLFMQHTHSSRLIHSLATRARAFFIFPKILLLSTAMASLRRDLSRFFHASVHASPPSPRLPKNTGRLCNKAGSSRSTLGRTKEVRKNHLTTLSRASMRSPLMSMCLSSMFRVLIPLVYGVSLCVSLSVSFLVSLRRQWLATARLASASIAKCSPDSR